MQSKARQSEAQQSKAKQSNAEQSKADQSKAKQSRAKQSTLGEAMQLHWALSRVVQSCHVDLISLLGFRWDNFLTVSWLRGPMDKASAHGAGDCRLKSYRDHLCPLSDKARGKQPRTQVLVSAGGPSVFSVPQLVCPDQFTAQRGARVDLTDRHSNLAE